MKKANAEEFVELMVQLKPVEIVGLATLMNIPLKEEGDKLKLREAEDVMLDIVNYYLAQSRGQRRWYLRTMRQTLKQHKVGESTDGTTTED